MATVFCHIRHLTRLALVRKLQDVIGLEQRASALVIYKIRQMLVDKLPDALGLEQAANVLQQERQGQQIL